MTRIGVVSDTHGLLRPEALEALAGSELIVHAGDVGGPGILAALREIGPVVAVRGNNDHGPWAEALPEETTVEAEGVRLHVIHDVKALDRRVLSGVQVVIAGHSHQPLCERRGDVLFFNPGSAGPRRFRLPSAVGRLDVRASTVEGRLIYLEVGPAAAGTGRPTGRSSAPPGRPAGRRGPGSGPPCG